MSDIQFDPNIDYGAVTPEVPLIDQGWEAPEPVFFGKKLPNGKIERKAPAYAYQEYPRMLYGVVEGRVRAIVVNNDADRDAKLAEGWVKGPGELGIITCPSYEQAQEMKRAKEAAEPVLETATVEIVKRKPGRPPKQ